jgi:hypothetical protein
MAADPWAAFSPQSDSAVTPLIARTPAPQTTAQSARTLPMRARPSRRFNQRAQGQRRGGADTKQKAMQLSAIESADQLIGAVKRARSLVSGWSTGVGGAILDHIPATQAAQLDTIVNQEIRGNIFLNRVNALKEENPSPTGGTGIGRIMQAEIPLITGSIGALDPVKMGRKGTLDSLDQIEARTLRTKAIINGENPDDPAVQKKYHIPGAADLWRNLGWPRCYRRRRWRRNVRRRGRSRRFPHPGAVEPLRCVVQGQSARHAGTARFIRPFAEPQHPCEKREGDYRREELWAVGLAMMSSRSVSNSSTPPRMILPVPLRAWQCFPTWQLQRSARSLSVVPNAIGFGLGKLGYNDAAGWVQNNVTHPLANPFQIGGAIENVAPTPDNDLGQGCNRLRRTVGWRRGLAMPSSAIDNVVSRFVGEAPNIPARSKGLTLAASRLKLRLRFRTEGIPAARPIADPSKRASMAYLETTPGGNNIVRNSLDQTRRSIADKVSAVAG